LPDCSRKKFSNNCGALEEQNTVFNESHRKNPSYMNKDLSLVFLG
jgi:hypothetical protein